MAGAGRPGTHPPASELWDSWISVPSMWIHVQLFTGQWKSMKRLPNGTPLADHWPKYKPSQIWGDLGGALAALLIHHFRQMSETQGTGRLSHGAPETWEREDWTAEVEPWGEGAPQSGAFLTPRCPSSRFRNGAMPPGLTENHKF